MINSRKMIMFVGVFALVFYYAIFAYQNRNIEMDDALIYIRYIENFIQGKGLVYNEGVRFNGLSSPLFSYVLALSALIINDAKLASWLLSACLTFAAGLSLWGVFLKETASTKMSPVFLWLGCLLFLSMPFFYLTYGFETGLYTLLSALFVYYSKDENYKIAGTLAALLFLTRPEGIFLIAAVGVIHLFRHRALPAFTWQIYVLPVAIVLVSFGFNYFYYGHFVAETGMAKVWQGQSGLWGEHLNFLNISYLYEWVFLKKSVIFGFLCVTSILGIVSLGEKYINLVSLIYLALYSSFYLFFNIPNYHWYYSPYFAFLPFYAAIGTNFALSQLTSGLGLVRTILIYALCLLPLGYIIFSFTCLNNIPRGGIVPYQELGKKIARISSANSVVAAVEIGAIGYYSQREIVDILGLVNPDNARYIGERDFDEWTKQYQVNYFVAHQPAWDHELSLFTLGFSEQLLEVCGASTNPNFVLYKVTRNAEPGIIHCAELPWKVGLTSESVSETTHGIGYIDSVRVVGNFLRLVGWAQNNGQPITQLGFQGAKSVMWRKQSRPDVVMRFNNSALEWTGFEVVVAFETAKQAQQAVGRCMGVTGHSGQQFQGIALDNKTTCR